MNGKTLVSWILKGVAVAMGVATIVLGILGGSTNEALITMLGIGLFALSLWSLQTATTNE